LGVLRPTRKSTRTMRMMAEMTAKSLMSTRACSTDVIIDQSLSTETQMKIILQIKS